MRRLIALIFALLISLYGNSAHAAVAFDATASNSVANSGGLTLTIGLTLSGSATGVGVAFQSFPAANIASVKIGTTALTLQQNQSFGGGPSEVQIWGLTSPPTGSQTITITFVATGAFVSAGAISVTGGATSGSAFSHSNVATGASTAPGVTVTSSTGEFVMDVVGAEGGGGGTQTPGGSQTLRWGPLLVSGNQASGSSLPAGASSTAMSWTFGSSVAWANMAASFALPGAATTSPSLGLTGIGQ